MLVATDVAARGLDIDDIDTVIHWQVRHIDSFVHRSGRTGRAGKSGTNLILTTKQEVAEIKQYQNQLKIKVTYQNQMGTDSESIAKIERDVDKLMQTAT